MLNKLELGVVGLPYKTIADDGVSPYKGILSQDDELVRSGNYVELASCQVRCTPHAEV